MFEVSCNITKRFNDKKDVEQFVLALDGLLGKGTHQISVREIIPLFTRTGEEVAQMSQEVSLKK